MSAALRIDVRLWGVLRRLAGAEACTVELPEDGTVESLAAALAATPELARELRRSAFAVGVDIVPRAHRLRAGDRVDVLPPVAGG